jgi:D-glycero-alpha-D-manno-heptose-7-phosphate kinase
MIFIKTPFRVSLFGGGTDFPAWFNTHGGSVLSFAINKYCNIMIRDLPQLFGYKYRAVYSIIESAKTINEIKHPAIREAIKKYGGDHSLEIQYHGELPARSGVGSSSAFAVSIINGLNAMSAVHLDKKTLAIAAIELEQEIIRENVGSQDQIACTYGGFNKITFSPVNKWNIYPLNLSTNLISEIEDRCFLAYTGIERISSNVSIGLIKNFKNSVSILDKTQELVDIAEKAINSGSNLDEIGELLKEASALKFLANPAASSSNVQEFINEGLKAGALGGKVLGAGGGGFCLFWLKKHDKTRFESEFKLAKEVPFKIDFSGSSIIPYDYRQELN